MKFRRRVMREEEKALIALHKQEDEAHDLEPSVPLTGIKESAYKSLHEKWWGGDSAEGLHLGLGPRGERKAFMIGDVTGGRDLYAGRLSGLLTNSSRWGQIIAQRTQAFSSTLNDLSDEEFMHHTMAALNHDFAAHKPTEINLASIVSVLNSHTREFKYSNAGNPTPIIYNVTKGKFMREHYFEPSGYFLGIEDFDILKPDKTVDYKALQRFKDEHPVTTVKLDPNDRFEIFMMTDGLTEAFEKRLGRKGEQFNQLVKSDLSGMRKEKQPLHVPLTPMERIIHSHFQQVKAGEVEDSHDALSKKIYAAYHQQFTQKDHENRLQMITVPPLEEYAHLLPSAEQMIGFIAKRNRIKMQPPKRLEAQFDKLRARFPINMTKNPGYKEAPGEFPADREPLRMPRGQNKK